MWGYVGAAEVAKYHVDAVSRHRLDSLDWSNYSQNTKTVATYQRSVIFMCSLVGYMWSYLSTFLYRIIED